MVRAAARTRVGETDVGRSGWLGGFLFFREAGGFLFFIFSVFALFFLRRDVKLCRHLYRAADGKPSLFAVS